MLAFVTDTTGQVVLALAALATTPIILRLTTEPLYGFWLTILSILGYLALADLGLGVSLVRLIAGLVKGDDADALSRAVSTAFIMYCAAGAMLLLIGLVVTPFLGEWFRIPAADNRQVVVTYGVALFASALFLPLSIFAAIVIGLQRMAVTNVIGSFIRLLAIGLSIVLLHTGFGVAALAYSSLFTVLADSLMCWWFARRFCPSFRLRLHLFDRLVFQRLLSFGSYFQFSRIANTVALSSDLIVIAATLGAAAVTPYAFTSKLAVLFSVTVASKLTTALFPATSEMFARKERDNLQSTFLHLSWCSVRMAVMAGVFLAVANRQFVSLWLGPEYFAGVALNAVFVYWVFQDTFYRGTVAMVYASGDLRRWSVVSIAEAILNLVTSVILVQQIGLVGVALGTSIGKTLTTAWFAPYWLCKKTELPVRTLLTKGVLRPLAGSAPGALLTVATAALAPTRWGWGWVVLVLAASAGGNLLWFEGRQLFVPSNEPWIVRLRQLKIFTAGSV